MVTDVLAYVAAGLVFATFCAQRMALLRALAIASTWPSSVRLSHGLWPILILHSAMLPINIGADRNRCGNICGTTT